MSLSTNSIPTIAIMFHDMTHSHRQNTMEAIKHTLPGLVAPELCLIVIRSGLLLRAATISGVSFIKAMGTYLWPREFGFNVYGIEWSKGILGDTPLASSG
jgi:hypothetical protein